MTMDTKGHNKKLAIFWFRRDLRLEDNCALFHALKSDFPVLPLFIFDSLILGALKEKKDKRVSFIFQTIQKLHDNLTSFGTTLLVKYGKPLEIWKSILHDYPVHSVYINHDYEPYSIERDQTIERFLLSRGIEFHSFKDQVIFEKNEVLKDDGTPYTVFTPYSKKWHEKLSMKNLPNYSIKSNKDNFLKIGLTPLPSLKQLQFEEVKFEFPLKKLREDIIISYHINRDFPGIAGTSRLGIHLRFGTISIRHMVKKALELNVTWLNELIWREFFMMILWHFPHVVTGPFKEKYSKIKWRNIENEFGRWCSGTTGYPMVDAGMRELNETGFMHNRVRMITASFLTKHLLIDWRLGENYFAEKLLDYELSSNNGNWQWAAGCGCDAAPYFRIFNPETQQKKFDPHLVYIKKWITELEFVNYPSPVVEHKFARERALGVYTQSLQI
jgi:deoxyribodipyrimidine photo-lyase